MPGRSSVRCFSVVGLATCVIAISAAGSRAEDPAVVGKWTGLNGIGDVKELENVAVHAHLLPTGDLLFWPRHEPGEPSDVSLNRPRLLNLASGKIKFADSPPYNLFCSSHTFLPDGRLFVAGGHIHDSEGEALAAIYDPFKDQWTRTATEMNDGRWYPTAVTLPEGDVLVVSGSIHPKIGNNNLPQVWDHRADKWRDLTKAGQGLPLPLYPFLHVAPNGKVFAAGPQISTQYLGTDGSGDWTNVADHKVTSFTQNGSTKSVQRDYGSSVMYDVGKVIVMGGNDPPLASAEIIDLNATSPAWTQVHDMNFPRRQMNATVLPDGTVFVSGGSKAPGFSNASGAVLDTELWDPKAPITNAWTPLAPQQSFRGYHSTAILLPDATVLSAGGGHPFFAPETKDHTDSQIFSPPYLFRGPRPVITGAPGVIVYNMPFAVGTPDPSAIDRVTLVRLTSVTHSFNTNQRYMVLKSTVGSGGLQVTAPPDGAEAPPGHYMLFLIDKKGVPSIATIVRL